MEPARAGIQKAALTTSKIMKISILHGRHRDL
jgi:hypothetical protein